MEKTFHVQYLILNLLLLTPSLWAKFKFSDKNYSIRKASIVGIYNLIIVMCNLYFADTGYIQFIGKERSPVVNSVTLYIVFAYVYALPRPTRYTLEEKHLADPTQPKIENHSREENLLYCLRLCLIIPACSAFYAGIALWGPMQFIKIEPYYFRIIFLLIALAFCIMGIFGIRKEAKKYGRAL